MKRKGKREKKSMAQQQRGHLTHKVIKGNEQTMRKKIPHNSKRSGEWTNNFQRKNIEAKQIIWNCVKVIKNYLLDAIVECYFKAILCI